MTSPELRNVKQARRRRDRAETSLRRADDELRDAVRAALKTSAPRQSIADAAGLTRQRINQIERGTR